MRRTRRTIDSEQGFALIAVLMLLSMAMTLLGAYLVITRIELATLRASRDTVTGFYAAEGGLNLRADAIRSTFVGYNTPSGTSPTATSPCTGSNVGSGSFACQSSTLSNKTVSSYVIDEQAGTTPAMTKIPQGDLYQNLWAQEYQYTANSTASGKDGKVEAILQLRFKSRLVPMFQFAAFYDKDLEILPGPLMTLSGPVHTNGDLYLNSDARLDISGQVTTAGTMYRGRKNDATCTASSVRVIDPSTLQYLVPSCTGRTAITTSIAQPFNGMVQFGLQRVTVPPPDSLAASPNKLYYSKADLRVVLVLDASGNLDTSVSGSAIRVRNADDSENTAMTTSLIGCAGHVKKNPNGVPADNSLKAIGTSNSFFNNREGKTIRMLDVDLQGLLSCLYTTNWLTSNSKTLGDSSEGGLVFYFTIKGPQSNNAANNYGIRVANGSAIAGPAAAPTIKGLTIVSDQAAYVVGDYNTVNKKPAAFLADSFNALSNAWYNLGTSSFQDALSTQALGNRTPTTTTHNFAILAGTDTTGGAEGAGGQGGGYNGGLENYPRFHENWTGITYQYRGSFVSLNKPQHVNGAWVYGGSVYNAPNRDWDYDTSFNNAANLPPITPRFVYLKQELFVRDLDQ